MARTVSGALSSQTRSPPTHLCFMDLPGEVRQMVYRMFAPIPPGPLATEYEDQAEIKVASELLDEDHHDRQMQGGMAETPNDGNPEDSENDGILTTRRSLLLTSRQVYNEFAPTFYNTTTIVMGSSCTNSPTKFTERFFDTGKTIVTSNIRTIVYYPLKWHFPTNHRNLLSRPLYNPRDSDNHGMDLLCQLLTEHPRLWNNLQTLRLHFQPALYYQERKSCWLDTEEHCNEVWRAMDWNGLWHEVVEKLLSGPLETSRARKEMVAVSVNMPGAPRLGEMESWRLTFDKRPKRETTD